MSRTGAFLLPLVCAALLFPVIASSATATSTYSCTQYNTYYYISAYGSHSFSYSNLCSSAYDKDWTMGYGLGLDYSGDTTQYVRYSGCNDLNCFGDTISNWHTTAGYPVQFMISEHASSYASSILSVWNDDSAGQYFLVYVNAHYWTT